MCIVFSGVMKGPLRADSHNCPHRKRGAAQHGRAACGQAGPAASTQRGPAMLTAPQFSAAPSCSMTAAPPPLAATPGQLSGEPLGQRCVRLRSAAVNRPAATARLSGALRPSRPRAARGTGSPRRAWPPARRASHSSVQGELGDRQSATAAGAPAHNPQRHTATTPA